MCTMDTCSIKFELTGLSSDSDSFDDMSDMTNIQLKL